jgi:SlyX protein
LKKGPNSWYVAKQSSCHALLNPVNQAVPAGILPQSRYLRGLGSTLPRFQRRLAGMADVNPRYIEKLESNLAHLEHQVEQLNGVVIEQGKLLERLKKEVQRQSTAMSTLELERIKANVQKPPHYQ